MTPQRSPDNSGEKCFLTIFNFSGDHSLFLLVQEEGLLLVQEDLLLVQEEGLLIVLAQDYYMTTIWLLYGYYMATTMPHAQEGSLYPGDM